MENQEHRKSVLSIKDWVITLIVAAIPLVGFIMLFVWGFGSGTNENKANFAKAALIVYAIMIGIYILFMLVFGAAIMSGMGNY
ncbi:MAG: hypothetical protein MI975_12085 [Cytophagales bacterium]|nr:hypothetical protein [Cytophagales bacterium]